jgi:chromosome segregation ATPase
MPNRPLEEVLAELRDAWTAQADLTDHGQRLAAERDALHQVTAIRARYAPDRQRLHTDLSNAEKDWAEARSRITDLDHTLVTETSDLKTRVRDAWRHDLAQVQQAAGVLARGAGRFGQRRRQVRDAKAELTVFADRWRPVHSGLPTDPVDLARQVQWVQGRHVREAIDAYVTRQVAQAHPEAADDRRVERAAWAAYETAEQNRIRLDNAMYRELRAHGHAALVSDPEGRLTTVTEQMAAVEKALQTATAAIDRLQNEPAIVTVTEGILNAEHSQWAANRAAQRDTAARQARTRWQRQQPPARIGPHHPDHPTHEHGPSLSR